MVTSPSTRIYACDRPIMDGLLDFGDDLRFLEIYKRLCRHIFYKHPQMVGEHIYLWRMQFDTKDEEDENE